MVKLLLREMMKTRSVARNINRCSVDNASRRETALICAARTGQLDIVRLLLNYGADLELRDGEGHTAIWCAVREQKEEMVGRAGLQQNITCSAAVKCTSATHN